jgi:hypothetical protein
MSRLPLWIENQFHTGTKLRFKVELDQTYLSAIAKALANIDP